MANGHASMASVVASLRRLHANDLVVYRRAHRERRNRWIHYAMIPVECGSFQVFVCLFAGAQLNWLVGIVFAVLSAVVATRASTGITTAAFHLSSSVVSASLVQKFGWWRAFLSASASWTASWAVQVGIGHYLFEKNSPNVANMSEVSYLAMCLSVLIAWSS